MAKSLAVEIARPAQECFERFCEIDRIGEWLPWIVDIQSVSFHRNTGLAAEVKFLARSEAKGDWSYALLYSYDASRRRVAWYPSEEAGQAVRGFAAFDEQGDGCRMTYSLELGILRSRDREEWEAEATIVIEAFRKWVEDQ